MDTVREWIIGGIVVTALLLGVEMYVVWVWPVRSRED